MLTRLKQKVQSMLTAEALAAHKLSLTPNRISAVGIATAFLAALSYTQWQTSNLYFIIAIAFLLLSGFCDALDGIVARIYQQATSFGGFLDSLLDRYAEAAVYTAIIIGGLCDPLWGLIALVGSILVSYTRARAEAANLNMESIGLAERAERLIILMAATLLAFFWQPATAMNWSIIALAILTNATVIQRAFYAYRKLKK